jgi:serine/threonine protein kinase
LVHGDIKPSNLIATAAGEIRICDIGNRAFAEAAGAWTGPGWSFGSPAYQAPEQRRGELIDARTDLYSLGRTLCALLAGQPSLTELPGGQFRTDIPSDLQELVQQLLEENPAERPETAVTVADILRVAADLLGRSSAPTFGSWLSGSRARTVVPVAVPAVPPSAQGSGAPSTPMPYHPPTPNQRSVPHQPNPSASPVRPVPERLPSMTDTVDSAVTVVPVSVTATSIHDRPVVPEAAAAAPVSDRAAEPASEAAPAVDEPSVPMTAGPDPLVESWASVAAEPPSPTPTTPESPTPSLIVPAPGADHTGEAPAEHVPPGSDTRVRNRRRRRRRWRTVTVIVVVFLLAAAIGVDYVRDPGQVHEWYVQGSHQIFVLFLQARHWFSSVVAIR